MHACIRYMSGLGFRDADLFTVALVWGYQGVQPEAQIRIEQEGELPVREETWHMLRKLLQRLRHTSNVRLLDIEHAVLLV